jgi:thiaminase
MPWGIRFVKELFAGAVPDAVMARYLIQDHRFLDSFLTLLGATDRLELYVWANEDRRHAVLIARLDNLGKGASGAAVQNLRLMLDLTPDATDGRTLGATLCSL